MSRVSAVVVAREALAWQSLAWPSARAPGETNYQGLCPPQLTSILPDDLLFVNKYISLFGKYALLF